ncbi:hypothetical protein LTR27_009888 [Elasticomyces elasticus]|nr:hypothetical protein LTR27_009888 [Elasticomyces elasticus]
MAPTSADIPGDGWQVVDTKKGKKLRGLSPDMPTPSNSTPPPPKLPSKAVMIGSTTKNGKSQMAKIEAGLKAQRDATFEKAMWKRLSTHSKHYHNHEAWFNGFESPVFQRDRFHFAVPLTIYVPDKGNLVFNAVRKILDEYNAKDFHSQLDPLDVMALSDAPTKISQGESESALLLLGRTRMFVKLYMKLARAHSTGYEVLVRDGTRKVLFRDWLETLPKHRMPNIEHLALEKQRKWWSRNRKKFRFADLPTELQNRVWLYAVGEYIESRATSRGAMDLTRARGYRHHIPDDLRVDLLPAQPPPVNRALFKVNKAMRQNALEVLQYDTVKRYRDWDGLHEIAMHVRPLYHIYLRHVELAMTHLEYFDVFKCSIKPFQDYIYHPQRNVSPQNGAWAAVLSKLPNLQRLDVYFMSTIEKSYSPWTSYPGLTSGVSRERMHPEIVFDRLPCQKTLVDWIMAFASEYILACKKLKTVRLTGFVKDQTKLKWEARLNEPNRDIDHTQEIAAEKEGIMSLPNSEFPPVCTCSHYCGNTALDEMREGVKNGHGHRKRLREQEQLAELVESYVFDFEDSTNDKQALQQGQDHEV